MTQIIVEEQCDKEKSCMRKIGEIMRDKLTDTLAPEENEVFIPENKRKDEK